MYDDTEQQTWQLVCTAWLNRSLLSVASLLAHRQQLSIKRCLVASTYRQQQSIIRLHVFTPPRSSCRKVIGKHSVLRLRIRSFSPRSSGGATRLLPLLLNSTEYQHNNTFQHPFMDVNAPCFGHTAGAELAGVSAMQQELESIQAELAGHKARLEEVRAGIHDAKASNNREEWQQLQALELELLGVIRELQAEKNRLSSQSGES